ncbi:MAG: hypothetical protein DLM60_03460 [Pseudonocardiales bacterium]|nr:hypothetical protein [Actinomycetota bacterium]PZS22938.1 MAG: hypothetical protein DLM60_03460 [Pseudonocardiales bacterium]
MARITDRPSSASRRSTGTDVSATNGPDPFDDQGQREEHSQLANLGDNDEGREQGLITEGGKNRNHLGENRGDREFGENRERPERGQLGERAEQGLRREQRPAMSSGFDTFAPVLGAWNQVFASWCELAGTMVKAQQQTFASMIGAASPHAKDSTSGEHRSRDHVSTGSRTKASTPDQIEHDRR